MASAELQLAPPNQDASTRRPFDYFRALCIFLGLVFLLAAVLKAIHLRGTVVQGDGLLSSRAFLSAFLALEGFFGLWLCFGWQPVFTRWAAIAWFAALFAASLGQAFSGQQSCACFGALELTPWAVALFDLGAVVALFFFRPLASANSHGFLASPTKTLWFVGLGLAIPTMLVSASENRSAPLLAASPNQIDLGTIPQGSSREISISLHNHTDVPVDIATWDVSCPCLSLGLSERVAMSGSQVRATILVDLALRPSFVGSLTLDARGKTGDGKTAFLIRAIVRVEEVQS